MLELDEHLPIRTFRLEARYSATRLAARDEMQQLAKDFEEAQEKFGSLEEEEVQVALQRAESQANVETADDAWDQVIEAFERRLLELANGSKDHPLYRKYFADVPSHVTKLSHHAEIMISKDLERALDHESIEDLRLFADRLRNERQRLEHALLARTRIEVEEARFANRVSLAKSILNKMRRVAADAGGSKQTNGESRSGAATPL